MKTNNYILLFMAFIMVSCNSKKPLEWNDDIAKLTNKDLKGWLRKAPFKNEWNIEKNDDEIVFTNLDQVFPFMGKFKKFDKTPKDTKPVYQEENIVFQDDEWGDSFMYGMLLYQPEELFLKETYRESGNVIFSGTNAIHESYTASLSETYLYEKNENYKAVVYWVRCNYKSYLFGYYQQGQLVVEFGFPCNRNNQKEGLQKLKEINHALGLNIDMWEKATTENLQINPRPFSFK